jgi:hypothetical protein
MQIFISWTDSTTEQLAAALCAWLPQVLPYATPFMCPAVPVTSLTLGERFGRMRASSAGLVCVTASALDQNWLFFELGALRNALGAEAIVAPVLLDVTPEEVSPTPLHIFQAVRVARQDLLRLIGDLNQGAELPITATDLETRYATAWDPFYESSRRIPGSGLHDFILTVMLPSRSISVRFSPKFGAPEWDETVERFIGLLPREPFEAPPFERQALQFLDVNAERWEQPPALLSRLRGTHVALVDQILLDHWGGNSRLAAEMARADVGSKPTRWVVRLTGNEMMLTKGMQ